MEQHGQCDGRTMTILRERENIIEKTVDFKMCVIECERERERERVCACE